MEKLKLFRALLVAVMMLGVSFAWADTKIHLYQQNFESVSSGTEVWTYSDASNYNLNIETDNTKYQKAESNSSRDRYMYSNIYTNTDVYDIYGSYTDYTIEFDLCIYGGNYNTSTYSNTDFAVMPDGYSFPGNIGYTWRQSDATNHALFYLYCTRTSSGNSTAINSGNETLDLSGWHHYVLNISETKVDYSITNISTSTEVASGTYDIPSGKTYKCKGFFTRGGRGWGGIKMDNVDIYTMVSGESVTTPTISAPTYAGSNRTVTITGGTSSDGEATVTTYYTTDGEEPSASHYTGSFTDASKNVIITANCTVKAISISSNDASSLPAGRNVTVGKLTLIAPTITKTAYSSNKYTVKIDNNQSSLDFVPASVSVYYSVDGGDATAYSVPFEVAEGSTVTAYVAADDYNNSIDATSALGVRPTYSSAVWSQDYRNIVTEDNTAKGVVLSSTSFDVNGTNFYNIVGYTHSNATVDITVDSHVGLNTASGFNLRKNGTYSGILQNSKNQYIGLQNLTVGDIIIVTTNGNWIDPNYGVTFLGNISTSSEFYFQIDETEASLTMYKGTYNYVYTISEIAPKWNAPTISEADAGENGWTVTITGDAGATLSYKIGTGEYQTYSAPFDVAASTKVTAKASGGSYGESTETVFTTSVKKLATPTVAYASYNYEQGGYTITPSCATEGVTFQYRIGTTGDFTDCTVPFYAKNGKLYVKAKKTGWTESDVFEGYDLNVAPSTTSPETLIAFQKTNDSGDKNIDHIYKSVTITGGNSGAIAGISGSGAKLKLRTNQSENTITLNVNSGYKVTGVSITANSNNKNAAITLTSTTVDGGSNIMGTTTVFPESGSSATNYSTGTISASNSIVFTFDNSEIDGNDDTKKNSQILASIVVTYMTPAEVEVADAIADCKTYETSTEFATYIDAGSYSSAAEVYAAHTAWQIAQAKASGSNDFSKVILDHAITTNTVKHYWGNLSDGSSAPYEGAPDNYYLTWGPSAEYSVWNGVYGLPAGQYTVKTYTYSSIAGDRNQYIAILDPWTDINTNAEGGSREVVNAAGWVETTSTFSISETSNLAFGFYAAALDGRTSGIDNWTLTLTGIPVTIGDAGAATLVSPYALDFTGIDDVKAYYASAQDGADITFTRIDGTVAANTPLYVTGSTTSVPVVATGDDVEGTNLLVPGTGAAVASEAGGKYNFILNKVGKDVGFYKANGQTVAVGKAYLSLPTNPFSGSEAKSLNLIFDGEATGINDISRMNNNGENITGKAIYNLSGQRIAAPQKGINIINGRKVVIK